MSAEEQRSEVIRYWWSRAEESLASAEREFEANAYSIVVNRVYYAAFYAVCAALLERQLPTTKHSGVRAAFHRELVKTGLLDIQWAKFYDRLFNDRQEGDYVALVSFEPDYVKAQLEQCQQFLTVLRPLIPALAS